MGFVAQAMERRASVGASVHPAQLDDPRVIFGSGYADDATGLNLSETDVLGWPAVMQALRIISWSIGMLPCHLYEKQGEGKKKLRQADEHPVYWLLHDEPHPDYTPFEFNSAMVFNALLRGNAYAQLVSKKAGVVDSLFPLDPTRMKTQHINGKLIYVYSAAGGESKKIFPSSEILHIKGFSDGGLLGFALNQISRTTLAKGVAMDRYGARVFKNGMASGSVIESDQPQKWKNDEERDRFYSKLQDRLQGEDNWHKVIGLPYGMSMKNLGISPKDAQLIEGLTFQVQDIARLTGVPPSLLMELSRATFSNVEQQLLQFVQLCLGPWLVNIEQRYKKSLLSIDERKRYVIKFLVDALLRTDLKTQNDALRVAVGQPWMSVNEARDLKELAPVDGGDEVAKPMNMGNPGGNPAQSVDPAGDWVAPPQDGDSSTRAMTYRNAGRAGYVERGRYFQIRESSKARKALREAYRKTILRDAQRLINGEIREVRKLMDKAGLSSNVAARSSVDDFAKSLQDWFEGAGFSSAASRTLSPTLRDFAESMAQAAAAQAGGGAVDVSAFIDEYIGNFERGTAGSHLGQLMQLIEENDAADLGAAIEQRLNEWEKGREDGTRKSQAEKIGDRESVQLGAGVARAAWGLIGVSTLVWFANSGACPICQKLDGRVVGIDESFVEQSGQITGSDDQPTLTAGRNINYPPIHGSCTCDIGPG